MFQMKNFKLIFLFLMITLFLGCASNLKDNKITHEFELSSDYGRFLSSQYSLKVGDNHITSKIISKSKNLHSDFTLAKLNFNSHLINGDFDKAQEFKLIATPRLDQLPMYNLPEFLINLKNKQFLYINNFSSMQKHLPGFNVVFEKINHIKLTETNNYKDILGDLKKTNIFDLLIFENTKIENHIYLNIKNTNFTLIEHILFLGYLKRKHPERFDQEINEFSLKFNYDIIFLKLYFQNKKYFTKKPDHKFIFANLFSYLSFLLSYQKNIANSYLKILNEISHYLEPSLGVNNYFLAETYSNEKNYKVALKKLNRINENSFMFLYSKIKKYKILQIIDKKKSNILLSSIQNKYPKNNEVLFLIANKFRNQNKCNKAIKLYDQLINKSIKKDNYQYLKAICLDKLDKWDKSKELLIKLITQNPNDAYILNYLSYSMAIRNEDLIEAKKLIIKALKIEKNNGFFLDTLGWIQFKMNDVDEAAITIQKAIELEPNNSEIIDHLGDIYYKIGRKKEAIFEWRRALIGNANNKLKKDIRSKIKKYTK